MIIKQEVSYYIQMEYEGGEWKSIGAMDMKRDYALESLRRKRETFPNNNFRIVGKLIRHEVIEEREEEEMWQEYSKIVAEGLERHTR